MSQSQGRQAGADLHRGDHVKLLPVGVVRRPPAAAAPARGQPRRHAAAGEVQQLHPAVHGTWRTEETQEGREGH
jgi:hypothetical protein